MRASGRALLAAALVTVGWAAFAPPPGSKAPAVAVAASAPNAAALVVSTLNARESADSQLQLEHVAAAQRSDTGALTTTICSLLSLARSPRARAPPSTSTGACTVSPPRNPVRGHHVPADALAGPDKCARRRRRAAAAVAGSWALRLVLSQGKSSLLLSATVYGGALRSDSILARVVPAPGAAADASATPVGPRLAGGWRPTTTNNEGALAASAMVADALLLADQTTPAAAAAAATPPQLLQLCAASY